MGEVPSRDLKGLTEAIGKQLSSGVMALVSTSVGKASVVITVSPDLVVHLLGCKFIASPSFVGLSEVTKVVYPALDFRGKYVTVSR